MVGRFHTRRTGSAARALMFRPQAGAWQAVMTGARMLRRRDRPVASPVPVPVPTPIEGPAATGPAPRGPGVTVGGTHP